MNLDLETLKQLTPMEAKILLMLQIPCQPDTAWRGVQELATAMPTSRETVRKALRKLESLNLVTTVRTRRNGGKFSTTVVQLTMPTTMPSTVGTEDSPCQAELASTDSSVSTNSQTAAASSTTKYLYPSDINVLQAKRKGQIVIGSWKDDDDELAGFGLLEPKQEKKPKASKRTGKNRQERALSEWTARDVASEFCDRLKEKFPNNPPLVNSYKLSMILGKNRKEYGYTAEVEMKLVEKWFLDGHWHNAPSRHQYLLGSFLNMFKQYGSDLLNNSGVSESEEVTQLVASDGTKFPDTAVGRRWLEKHEEALK